MTQVTLIVAGRPGPQGSKRHVGNGVLVESSKRVRPWREAVKESVRMYREVAQNPELRFERGAPLGIEIAFTFDPPKSAPKRRRIFATTRSTGDLDKLVRATFDALSDSALIWDDAQFVDLRTIKDYGGLPGAVIRVYDLDPSWNTLSSPLRAPEPSLAGLPWPHHVSR